MPLGDGIRYNVAKVSKQERDRLRDAIVALNGKFYPDGVSYWFKQDQIHQATHVHGGPAFLPWHRELCNRFEALLREFDPGVSLHYWDWQTDPRSSDDGQGGSINLLTAAFMGGDLGRAGAPLEQFDNNDVVAGSRDVTQDPANPPRLLERELSPGVPDIERDDVVLRNGDARPDEEQFPRMRKELENSHNIVHGYIGGNIGSTHSSFEDPFVFLLHSNLDRLFASWQLKSGKAWRLDPDRVYGAESATTGPRGIITPLEPWAGEDPMVPRTRPWAPPENEQLSKNSRDPSVVTPPRYDKYVTLV